jgi:hypothetical protein
MASRLGILRAAHLLGGTRSIERRQIEVLKAGRDGVRIFMHSPD